MIEVKGFAGILDSDNPPTGVPNGFHIMAKNGRFKGVNGKLQFENIEGTREIIFAKPAGDNECVGAFYSPVDKIIYWCNYNSNGNHCIFQIYTPTETVIKVLQSNTGTVGNILNFTLDNPIHEMDILYGSEGNTLYFIDSLGIPTEIDLNLFINNPYAFTKREFIDVAKAPFVMPPKVAYENDNNTKANNLLNSLFQFRVRPVYNNNEKPVYSAASEVPLPYLPYDQNINKDTTKNSRIGIYLQTGDANVKEIDIAGRMVQNDIVSDWFKITTLNKADLTIPDNSIYKFLFYNDTAYTFIATEGTDPNTQVLNLQDYVPQTANAQCLLNGNVTGYAGITEGYDKVNANIQVVSVVDGLGRANNKNGINFFATQNSLFSVGTGNQIIIYLSGVGTNDGTTNQPTTLINSNTTRFEVKAQDATATDKSFFYLSSTTNETISSILTALSTAAQAVGYTQVSLNANSLVLSYTGITLLSSQTRTNSASSVNEAVYANAQRATYGMGVMYFDSKGRTNGVTYGTTFNTQPDTGATNLFELRIYHRPPIWATYYHVVRTKNTTYSKLLTWVSDAAVSNKSAVDSTVYAYIGISSIKEYNEEISSTEGVVSYEFNKGDRIRFIERYLSDGTVDNNGYANLDYEILGTVQSPIINGVAKEGTFVKILYPTTDISADFKLDGTDDFQNYKIWLYGKAVRTDKDLEFFYEFGQQYGILNAGTPNAAHAGMIQSQTANLSQPAKIIIDKGDLFFRYRNVVSGNDYPAEAGGNTFGNHWATAKIDFPADVTTTSYEIRSNSAIPVGGLASTDYPTYTDTDYLFFNKLTTNAVNIKIKATFKVKADDDAVFGVFLKELNTGFVFAPVVITDIVTGLSLAEKEYKEVTIDGIYYVAPLGKIWLLMSNINNILSIHIDTYSFELTALKYNNISIVEKSFSDLYDIELSADGRVAVIDENAAQTYFPAKFRWGLNYLQDTNINNINRFYAANYDEWDRAKGDVMRLKVRERILKIFQKKGVGQTGIYTKFVQDSGGSNILTTTDDIITKNNVNYYEGEYGIGDYPTSLISTDAFDKFVDPIRGYEIISDNSGLRAVNELYLGQYYIRELLSKYNKTWLKTNGSRAKIMGVYNYVDEEYNCILEGGVNGEDEIYDYNFSFNVKRKGYSNFYDWHSEWAISAEDKIYSWKNGSLYVHDNVAANKWCNFYDTPYDCFITLPFNDNLIEKKGWQGIVEQANVIWAAPEIYSQVTSYSNLMQESNLLSTDFRQKEGMYHASFLRDLNSVGGISRGYKLKGTYIIIKFQPIDSSNFVFLASVSIKYLNSPLVPA